jgi:ABC-2 type transport system permease protein
VAGRNKRAQLARRGHIPRLPAKELTATPLLLLTGIAAALVFAGLAAFRRREIIMM